VEEIIPVISLLQKLDKLIVLINQLKSKCQSYSVQRVTKQRLPTESATRAEIVCGEAFYDCSEIPVVRPSPQAKTADKKLLLRVVSSTCIFLVYAHFICLAYLVTYAQLRLGFIFLITCVVAISWLTLQVRNQPKLWPKFSETPRRIKLSPHAE
jgi:hypothetical protein